MMLLSTRMEKLNQGFADEGRHGPETGNARLELTARVESRRWHQHTLFHPLPIYLTIQAGRLRYQHPYQVWG